MLMFNLEHYLRFFSIKSAEKRGSTTVQRVDVENAIKKFGKPEKLIKSEFKDHATFSLMQSATLRSLEWLGEKLHEVKRPIVLDAGCGWGRSIINLRDYYGKDFEMVGVDTDKFSLRYGRKLSKLLNVVKSGIQNLPFGNNSFNLILCSGVIHEVKTHSARNNAIREFYRVLKPNGALCIVDAFSANPVINIITRILQHVTSQVEWMFPKARLEKILKENNFEIVSVKKTRSRLFGAVESFIILTTKKE
jgi:ubiquinone/menaquinone biosynthesis C-methylase UbiE